MNVLTSGNFELHWIYRATLKEVELEVELDATGFWQHYHGVAKPWNFAPGWKQQGASLHLGNIISDESKNLDLSFFFSL